MLLQLILVKHIVWHVAIFSLKIIYVELISILHYIPINLFNITK